MKRVATVAAVAMLVFAVIFTWACGASNASEYLDWTKSDWEAADFDTKSKVAQALREDLANNAIEYGDFVPQGGCGSCSWAGVQCSICSGFSLDESFQALRSAIESIPPSEFIDSIDGFFSTVEENATLQSYVAEIESRIRQAKGDAEIIDSLIN